jgi:RimJ/RimL family protein N-acetyltransferase
VTGASAWPAAEPIETARLWLEPQREDHADEMASVLDDVRLHTFIGGEPATASLLRQRYARQAAGQSPDGREGWLNWIVRRRDDGAPLGTVQATLRRGGDAMTAEIAWVVAIGHQGHGYATEAAGALASWLQRRGAAILTAHIHPEHGASIAVARRLGMRATGTMVDGETRWIGGETRDGIRFQAPTPDD